jgi:hypothetical protein
MVMPIGLGFWRFGRAKSHPISRDFTGFFFQERGLHEGQRRGPFFERN